MTLSLAWNVARGFQIRLEGLAAFPLQRNLSIMDENSILTSASQFQLSGQCAFCNKGNIFAFLLETSWYTCERKDGLKKFGLAILLNKRVRFSNY
jgi:hypothetical protein